jgi:hypothetical protein
LEAPKRGVWTKKNVNNAKEKAKEYNDRKIPPPSAPVLPNGAIKHKQQMQMQKQKQMQKQMQNKPIFPLNTLSEYVSAHNNEEKQTLAKANAKFKELCNIIKSNPNKRKKLEQF